MAHTAIPDPATLRAQAHRLRIAADDLSAAMSKFRSHVDQSAPKWHAPAADRFRSEATTYIRSGDSFAASYREQAARLEALARQAEHDRTLFGGLERRAREAIDDMIRLGQPLPFSGPFNPLRLPPPFDPGWADVARRLGIH